MTSATQIFAVPETRFRREFLIAVAGLAVPLAVLLVSNPGIDLAVSYAVREACAEAWCRGPVLLAARYAFIALFAAICLVTLFATARTIVVSGRWLGSAQARCWFVIACLIVGPGIVANLVLKDNLGRARPRDVIEFGGTKTFTPAFVPSRQCPENCSFVSGEASSIYAAFFALALVLPQFRLALLAGGIAAGSIAGLIRMMQGAHFLSDVVFAGIFMALTVSLLHIALIGLWRDAARQTRGGLPLWPRFLSPTAAKRSR